MLEIADLSKRFGPLVAVDGVSLRLDEGEVVGIMGVNGAGKTTLLNCISGLMRADDGSIVLGQRPIHRLPPHRISALGVGRTFQIPRSFRGMTVLENLLIVPASGVPLTDMLERARRALESVRLSALSEHYAEELSGGQRKLLELARIMMIDPKLILMDEPFAGMHPDLCAIFIGQVEKLAKDGVGVLLVSHDPDTLYRLSNGIVVMHQGQIIATGTPQEIQRNPAVIDAYLGTDEW